VMDAERPALTAAAATATVIIELEKRSRMTVSFWPAVCYCNVLLQRLTAMHPVQRPIRLLRGPWSGSGPRPPEGEVFHAPSAQQPREAIVSFDAARLIIIIKDWATVQRSGRWPDGGREQRIPLRYDRRSRSIPRPPSRFPVMKGRPSR